MQRISWKICLGCENMCATVLKAQATMGEAFLTCLEVCLWWISLCLDVQKFIKDVTAPRESAGTMYAGWRLLWQKTQFALWGMKTNSPKKWRQPHPKRGRPNSKIADDIPKKGRQPYPKTEDDLTQKSIFCKYFFKNALNRPKNTSFRIIFWLKFTTFCNFLQKN